MEPAEYGEPKFSYCNRSARPGFQRVRELLESWYVHYPLRHRRDLCSRFRSADDPVHLAAFYELFLFELLRRLGCKVHVHPCPTASEGRSPDFQAIPGNGMSFYLEAVIATDESERERAARLRLNRLIDQVNRKLLSPNFFLSMRPIELPGTVIPARRIARFLEACVRGLDPDVVGRAWRADGDACLPKWLYDEPGCKIEFFPVPKKPAARLKDGARPIGSVEEGMREIKPASAIRKALLSKAGRYGRLELPYVIAVNCLGDFVEQDHVAEALFGTEAYELERNEKGFARARPKRIPDGLWTSRSGPRYEKLCAVLVSLRLLPWNLAKAGIRLYHNPWVAKPFDSALTQLPQAVPKAGKLNFVDGATLASVFEIRDSWPFWDEQAGGS